MNVLASNFITNSGFTRAKLNNMQKSLFVWLLFGTTYISQHIGFSFMSVTLIVLLRQHGASLDALSLMPLIVLPFSLRFLWSPVVERFGHSARGHFKNWLIPVQCLMVFSLLTITIINPTTQIYTLFLVLLIFAAIIGFQDLALDGLVCSAFSQTERTTINSIQIGSGMLGNLVGGGLVILYPHLEWQGSILILSLICCIPLFFLIRFQEPTKTKIQTLPLRQGWFELFRFWHGKLTWLGMLFIYAIAFSGGFSILSPTLVDGGWSMTEIGMMMNYGVLIGLVAVISVVPLSKKFCRKKTVRIFTALQLISLIALLPLSFGKTDTLWAYLAVTACYLSFAPMFTLNSAIMMDLAAKSTTPTIAYTVQIAVAMLFSILASTLSLATADYFGYSATVLLSIGAALITLMTMPLIITRITA
ncbi:MFS transporter [Testudinibacter sp. TR-2022]|uniref:MFS transporter n=2 Tax=Testudinibacter sp. TR-2022 TaxID=2585029 RepID=UPI00111B951C|nr:MFS transporter [Testudinibacter sp. TR-2022]TNH24676.1 MFS transporter [Testudinibacter sp. TR-2022]